MPRRFAIDEIVLSKDDVSRLIGLGWGEIDLVLKDYGTPTITDGCGKLKLCALMHAVVEAAKDGYEFDMFRLDLGSHGPLACREISNAEAAQLLGLSGGRISQLAADSVFKRTLGEKRGYILGDVCVSYLKFLGQRDWYLGWSHTGRHWGGRWRW